MAHINTLISQYPKTRPPLSPQHQKIYQQHYLKNRHGHTPATAISNRFETWLHYQIALDVRHTHKKLSTLEIGAGTLNQIPYEPHLGPYDIVEPFTKLYQHSPHLPRIHTIYSDINQIPTKPRYHRITSIATFEHITNLPQVIARSCLLLKPEGCLRISIPNQGSLIWRLAWQFSTALEYRLKYGLSYHQLMRHEHVNTASEIHTLLQYFFRRIQTTHFGPSSYFSLYHFYHATNPRTHRATNYLSSLA